jgi:hypothetical protein
VTFRTIVINGDETWSFFDLLWTHGLDLYPPETNVSFVSTVDPARVGVNPTYRLVLGNFPESFAEDPTSLENEISDEVTALDGGGIGRLAVLAVISAEDFDRIAGWPAADRDAEGMADRLATLSPSGAAAVGALRAAAGRIAELSGDRGEFSPLARKLWLALAVRARGYEVEHKRHAGVAMSALAYQPFGIDTTFFLSNGRNLDESAAHPHQHFVKLRLLIDILQADTQAQMPEAELKGEAVSGGGGIYWVRFADAAPSYLDHPAILQSRLVELYGELRSGAVAGDGDDPASATGGDFESNAAELAAIAGAPMALQDGISELKSAGKRAPRPPETDDPALPGTAPMPEDMALDYGAVRRGGLLRSRQRMERIKSDTAAFEDDISRIAETMAAHTRARIAAELETVGAGRRRVAGRLVELRLPEAQAPLDRFRDDLAGREATFRSQIEAAADGATSATGGADPQAETTRRRAERDDLRQRLLSAEQNLLGPGILVRIPFLLFVVVLLPFVVMLAGRAQYGTMPALDWATIEQNVFPVPYIMGVVVVIGLLVGLLRAWVMARRRDRARRALGVAMQAEYDLRIEQNARPLVRAINRKRLSVLNLVSSHMKAVDPAMIQEATDALIRRLETTRRSLGYTSRSFQETVQAVAASATHGFGQGVLKPERVSGFLRSVGTLPGSRFHLRLPGAERRDIAIASRTGPQPPDLVFRDPGSVLGSGHA